MPFITNFEERHRDLWGRHTVKMRHALEESGLFSDASLASLIDNLPSERIAINTMAPQGHRLETWSYCDRAGHTGATILDVLKSGRLWINLTRLETVDARFARLLEGIFAELRGHMPEFETFKHSVGVLISSPNAQVFYHADPPGQALWQIRGRKRIWIYPSQRPFLQDREIENVIRGITEEEITYQPWYDEYAEVHDLADGDMLHWPLNRPHRVMNLDTVNVSVTTEHWTPEIRRSYAMNYGNGILRDLGVSPRSRNLHGPSLWGKVALTAAWRMSGAHRQKSFRRTPRFRIDPRTQGGLVPIPQAQA